MTNTYNTGNPLGSTDPRDLLDNASNLDDGMNSTNPTFVDRLGVTRDTWAGQQNSFNTAQTGRASQFDAAQTERDTEFQEFLTSSGFVSLGNYAGGLNFTLYNQYMARGGFFYRPAPSSLPFTTTGTWVGADEDLFVLFSQDDVLRQDLAEDNGATLIGAGVGVTVAEALTALEEADTALSEEIADLANSLNGYADATPTAGSVTLTAGAADTFGVQLTADVTTVTLAGEAIGKVARINVIFSQDETGGHTVALPANAIFSEGTSEVASTVGADVTLGQFVNYNGAATWFYRRLDVFSTAVPGALPDIPDENSTFNDEGDSTSGWTASNATLGVTASRLRQTKTAGGSNSSMTKSATFTPTNSDYILYGKIRAKYTTDDVAVVWLLNGSKEVSIWLGSANGGGSATLGAISFVGTTGASTKNIASVATGYNYETTDVEFALQYDHKFATLTCWFRETDGRWKWKGRVACDWFSSTQIQVLTTTPSAAGCWVEFDYLTLARPNVAVISDSISEGKTLFSPDPALALTNDESTWMRHANIYPTMRNNLVVNKGVGSNTSANILSRITDVTGTGARVVFLQASSNDEAASVSQATRKSNIQSSINAMVAASQEVVLLNGSHGTAAGSDNTPSPDLRDYMVTSWTTQLNTLTALYSSIDVMEPVKDGSNFLAAGFAADGIHFNVAGHTAVGEYIESVA